MGNRRLLGMEAGIATYHHYDEMEDKTYIETVQNVEPYLDFNRKMANDHNISDLARKKNLVRVGSIPVLVQHEWMKKYGITSVYAPEHRKKVISLLNSPEYKYLKTVTGKI